MSGMLVWVYKNGNADCSNGGISSMCSTVVLMGKGIPQLTEADEKTPAVLLKGDTERGYVHAVPCTRSGKEYEGVWFMFGGSFIYTTDSRFPSRYPIPLHDRSESEQCKYPIALGRQDWWNYSRRDSTNGVPDGKDVDNINGFGFSWGVAGPSGVHYHFWVPAGTPKEIIEETASIATGKHALVSWSYGFIPGESKYPVGLCQSAYNDFDMADRETQKKIIAASEKGWIDIRRVYDIGGYSTWQGCSPCEYPYPQSLRLKNSTIHIRIPELS